MDNPINSTIDFNNLKEFKLIKFTKPTTTANLENILTSTLSNTVSTENLTTFKATILQTNDKQTIHQTQENLDQTNIDKNNLKLQNLTKNSLLITKFV